MDNSDEHVHYSALLLHQPPRQVPVCQYISVGHEGIDYSENKLMHIAKLTVSTAGAERAA